MPIVFGTIAWAAMLACCYLADTTVTQHIIRLIFKLLVNRCYVGLEMAFWRAYFGPRAAITIVHTEHPFDMQLRAASEAKDVNLEAIAKRLRLCSCLCGCDEILCSEWPQLRAGV